MYIYSNIYFGGELHWPQPQVFLSKLQHNYILDAMCLFYAAAFWLQPAVKNFNVSNVMTCHV